MGHANLFVHPTTEVHHLASFAAKWRMRGLVDLKGVATNAALQPLGIAIGGLRVIAADGSSRGSVHCNEGQSNRKTGKKYIFEREEKGHEWACKPGSVPTVSDG